MHPIFDLAQFLLGAWVMVYGARRAYIGWPKSENEKLAGEILLVLGAVILLMLRG